MARRSTIGRAELPILQYISEHAPVSMGVAAKYFAESAGLARTTVLTVMDRLRHKGFLTRKRIGGVYQYAPRIPKETLLQTLVRDFVQETLAGSLTPFVAYLTDEAELSDDQVAELKRLIQDLETPRKEKRT